MNILLPNEVDVVLRRLKSNNYDAYVVGGSIRDITIGLLPHDWDVATSALPKEVMEIFKDYKTVETGIKYGTVTVIINDKPIEITTFRNEGLYTDGRRPEWISFGKSIIEDLRRRDFTINAIAYNREDGFIDPYGGLKDINDKVIRCVGDPKERFLEDALRMMRAVRFCCQLDFYIEKNTLSAIYKCSDRLKKISIERITAEFFKILTSQNPIKGLNILEKTKLLDYFLPELTTAVGFDQKNPNHDKDVFDHTLCVVDRCPNDLDTRLAGLFHDIGKPSCFFIDEEGIGHFYGHNKKSAQMAEDILTRWKCSKDRIKIVTNLVREHMIFHNQLGNKGLKRLIGRIGRENIHKLIALNKADISCSCGSILQDEIEKIESSIREILSSKEAMTVRDLAINGRDIIQLGIPQGKRIGEILNYLLELVLENPEYNTKEKLIDIVQREFINDK